MINEKTLLDAWIASGSTYESFKETLTELSDCTEFVKVNPAEVSVLSLLDSTEEKARFWELCPCNTGAPQEDVKIRSLLLSKVLTKGDHKQLIDETLKNAKALFFCDDRVFFPAQKIFSKGLVQFGAGGSAMDNPSYERDLYVASLFKNARKSTFVVREIAGIKKLVAILSSKYKALPQSALCEIIEALGSVDDFGKMDTYSWTMDNWTSSIYVEFREKAEEIKDYYELKDEFVPGLWLQTSDTGESSVKIYPTWRRGHSIIYIENAAVKRVHTGKVELEDIIERVKKNAFSEYSRLPNAMCNLMTQTLTDESWDLTKAKDAAKNHKLMENVIKKAFKTLGITKAIGKGYEKSLREQLTEEFSGSVRYTAYDAAAAILSLPGRLEGVNPVTLHKLEAAVAEAPYIMYGASVEEPAEDLVLT